MTSPCQFDDFVRIAKLAYAGAPQRPSRGLTVVVEKMQIKFLMSLHIMKLSRHLKTFLGISQIVVMSFIMDQFLQIFMVGSSHMVIQYQWAWEQV